MTDLTPTAPHLDDEALVALLDGEAGEAERVATHQHLDGCDTCLARRDALAGAATLAATPVEPLADDLKKALVFRAIMATTADEGPHPLAEGPAAAPVVLMRPRRKMKIWNGQGIQAAAAIVVVAAVAAGAWAATRHSAVHAASSRALAAGSVPLTASTIAGHGGSGVAPAAALLELRPVVSGTSGSCVSVTAPDPAKGVSLPDAIYSPADRQACLTLGPALSTLVSPAQTTIGGPGGLTGPDTLTIHLPAAASQGLASEHFVPSRGSGGVTLPGGQRLVAATDGAVIGVVASLAAGPDGTEVVVIDEISPAVAEYLTGLLTG